jgi:general nucleoside transport system ATP-binding protein
MLRLVDVDKRFGAIHAVQSASLEILPGRVHAVVGENGAGKSTLLKIAAGLVAPDVGEVRIDRRLLAPHTAKEAIRRGIGMVQQHFALIDSFTVLENLVLGVEPTRLGWVDRAVAREKARAVARELDVDLPLDARVESLGVGDRQRVEIARALCRDARILILDEPTAVLTHGEAEALYATLRRLAAAGRAIAVVTHKLGEVVDFADEVTVMRRGKVMMTRELGVAARTRDDHERAAREAEIREITEQIMGGGVPEFARHEARPPGEPVLVLSDVRRGRALNGVSFEVRAGEIVGIAGVDGNGQRELVELLAGLEKPDGGRAAIVVDGKDAKKGPPVAIVHEDRQRRGLVLDADVCDNVLLGAHGRCARWGVLSTRAMDREARERLERAGAPLGLSTLARALSGGNQQKVMIARALAKLEEGAVAFVLAQPTRGVDLGASRAIHQQILEAAAKKIAVLVISADLAELRAVCDRILVLARGRIAGEFAPSASDQEIGRAMLSTVPGAGAP